MIRGEDIDRLVELLDRRGVCIFHACQLADFESYLRLGGIPSRACLEQRRQTFTTFDTDQSDREKEVWDKVFANLSDFGSTFSRGHIAVPNPYGPIVLQVRPAALRDALDIAICLRSAGAQDFNRQREALKSIEDIDRLFRYPAEAGFPESTEVKFAHEREQEFGVSRTSDPEISCTIASGRLALQHVIVAWVDAYKLRGRPLHQLVTELASRHGTTFRVKLRSYSNHREEMLDELAQLIAKGETSISSLLRERSITQPLRRWAEQIHSNGLGHQFRRYAQYLREGTLAFKEVSHQAGR